MTDKNIKGVVSCFDSLAETETDLSTREKRLDARRILKRMDSPYASAAPSFHADRLLLFETFRPSFWDIDPKAIIHAQHPPTHQNPRPTIPPIR